MQFLDYQGILKRTIRLLRNNAKKAIKLRANAMNEKELKNFLLAQIEEINRYKWIESEKQKQDIGFQKAASEWIRQYSGKFKRHYSSITDRKKSKKP